MIYSTVFTYEIKFRENLPFTEWQKTIDMFISKGITVTMHGEKHILEWISNPLKLLKQLLFEGVIEFFHQTNTVDTNDTPTYHYSIWWQNMPPSDKRKIIAELRKRGFLSEHVRKQTSVFFLTSKKPLTFLQDMHPEVSYDFYVK